MKVRYRLLSSEPASDESTLNDTIAIALMLNCRIVDEFRGLIIGVDGWVPLGDKRAHIAQVSLWHDIFPMVEVATNDEYHHPLELESLALNIARAVRATGKVQIGNRGRILSVSIHDGTSIEIVGMPRIRHLPPLAHHEAIRQRSLLDLRDEMLRRGLSSADFSSDKAVVDITGFAGNIGGDKLKQMPAEGIFALVLPGMKGLEDWETGPGCSFAGEIAGRLKAINGKSPNQIGMVWDEALQNALRNAVKADDRDAVVVMYGNHDQMAGVVQEIIKRCADACRGVPRELRRWLPDGTTEFVRLLPGEPIMPPDDLSPVTVSAERVAAIRAQLPPSPFSREQRWLGLGLHPELVRDMLDTPSQIQGLFDAYLDGYGGGLAPAAHFLSSELKAANRTDHLQGQIESSAIAKLLAAFRQGRIARVGLSIGFEQFLAGGMEALEVYLAEEPGGIVSDPEGWARREVSRLQEEDPTARPASIMAQAMEQLMLEANGKVEGARLAEAVRVALEQ